MLLLRMGQHLQPKFSHRLCRRRCRRHHPAPASWLGVVDYVLASLLIISNGDGRRGTYAQNANNFFCGTTWSDASNNCSERVHCPGATDEECGVAGQMCFSDTLCDASNGDGLPAATGGATSSFAFPYEDKANTRFCQIMGSDSADCVANLWCGANNLCMEGMVCGYSTCHLHDVMASEIENQAKEALLAKQKEEQQALIEAAPDDPIRNNFCGNSWEDASAQCKKWCMGEESECPNGEGCFAQTTCYSEAGLVPSESPTTYSPTTKSPTPRADPINFKFCGKAWDQAPCAKANHCPIGTECADGETCFTSETCNIQDLTDEPTLQPTEFPTLPISEDPSYFMFCGKTYADATERCSVNTICESDDSCPSGESCFKGLPDRCNSFYMLHPEFKPTAEPSHQPTLPQPTVSPTITIIPTIYPTKSPFARDDPRNMRFCGSTWDAVVCSLESHCPTGVECTNGELCFTKDGCNAYDLTATPTIQPSAAPIRSPTISPSLSPTLPRNDPSYFKFCGRTNTQAARDCSLETHCGFDDDCPSGTLCLDTPAEQCDAFAMLHQELIPSMAPQEPSIAPSMSPTTAAPVLPSLIVNDPGSMRFCGRTWETVKCSIEAHCPTGTECPDRETCFTNEQCNVHDLTRIPSTNPPTSAQRPTTPSGRDTQPSSLSPLPPTFIPTSKRKTIPPSLQPPTESITEVNEPTIMPSRTQSVNSSKWCGQNQEDANSNCSTESMPCSSNSCPYGWECFDVDDQFCASASASNEQTISPTSFPTKGSERPSKSPTQLMTSMPTQSTNEPTQYAPTEVPTNEYDITTEDEIETIVSTLVPAEIILTPQPTTSPTKQPQISITDEPSSDMNTIAEPSFGQSNSSVSNNEVGIRLPSQRPTSATTNETMVNATNTPSPSLRNRTTSSFPDNSVRYYDLSEWYASGGERSLSMNWKIHATWSVILLLFLLQ